MKARSGIAITTAAVAALAACQPGAETAEAAPPPEGAPSETARTAADAVADPDTTGAAIWAHLQASDYAETWEVWPDKGRRYPGQQPHGATLTTVLNDVAYDALMSGADAFPNGSIIVKRNFGPDGSLAAVTTMYKRDGYNEAHNDWFFSKHLQDGELDASPDGEALEGRVAGCQGCHIGKADNDYIFTGELGS